MLIFRYKALFGLLFVKILNCGAVSLGAKVSLDAKPACHIAAHHAAFSARAFCRVQLICGAADAELRGVERNGMQRVVVPGCLVASSLIFFMV